MGVIVVSAICFEREDGAVLTVRKRGTGMWMLPGGKPDPGEGAAECAVREVREELGVALPVDRIELVDVFETRAANEAGFALRATVFRTRERIEPVVQAEIEGCRWILPAVGVDDPAEAPLNREHVFPLLLAERAAAARA
ncbi:NUDIX hydrolase [Agrococcus terreus]|uniref:MutT/NUDIX family protein n=1 Tax=Agrococcus terreus TaxID=574649 RepID=A0ABQ2KBN3_9MICO|nr:NUDIX domain-containing protein [Agrococcus terreus]GGN77565.1 MutT/NUDIX family protein [Agrococcus terreus]